MALRYSTEFSRDFQELRDRQVAENAVETKSNVYRGVRFRHSVQEMGDLEGEVYGNLAGSRANRWAA